MQKDGSTDWWDDRMAAMEAVLGKSDDMVLHALVPFSFGEDRGGRADVVAFRKFVSGIVYATSDLIGDDRQVQNALGNYELAICHRTDQEWGARLLGGLANYTLVAKLEPGQTIEVGPAGPAGSSVSAFLLSEFGTFTVRGRQAGLLLLVGITADELSACRQGERSRVEEGLRLRGVYPFTDVQRRSVLEE